MTVWATDELKFFLGDQKGALLRADVEAWHRWKQGRPARGDDELFDFLEQILSSWEFEFRNIVDYRLGQADWWSVRPNLAERREATLWITCNDIGGGLIVQHGNSTRIFAHKIGRNLWVNQNVTIGANGEGAPTIGNDVKVLTGAVVVGPIHIGNGVVIGENALVDFDVPDGATVVAPRSVIVGVGGARIGGGTAGAGAVSKPVAAVQTGGAVIEPSRRRMTPVFLIARPRSGTTAFRATLEGHPDMAMTLGEVFHEHQTDHPNNFFSYYGGQVAAQPLLALPSVTHREQLLYGYLQHLANRVKPDVKGVNIMLGVNYNSLHVLNHFWQNYYQAPFLIELVKRRKLKVIHLIRRNIFKALVSEARAKTVGNWHRTADQAYEAPPKFELPLDGLALELELRDAEIRLISSALAGYDQCLTLHYETLFDEDGQPSVEELARVEAFIGLGSPIRRQSRYQKTGDESLEQTVSNADAVRAFLASSRWASMTY